jgi:SAM-dependent methyltransferase
MNVGIYKRELKRWSRKSREQKFQLFHSVFQARPEDRVLDVGVSGKFFAHYTFEDSYPYPDRITAGTIRFDDLETARRAYPLATYAVFDGCRLPFADQSFDIVFSNAVIEHIVGDNGQIQFAREIIRVGKSWFVTTPNYWFPLEPHYHLPFIQFMPRALQREYNRLFGTSIPKGELQDLALVSARELRRLFPTSVIARMRVTFWPETLVAYHVNPGRSCSTNSPDAKG